MQALTDAIIRSLPAPKTGMAIVRDSQVRGLGVRVLPSGTKAFVLDYTAGGRRRVYTIGKVGDWTLKDVREHAKKLKFRIREDKEDPAQESKEEREALTVQTLCEEFIEDELPKLRQSTQRDYRRMITNDIVPAFGKLKVVDVQNDDIKKLFKAITRRGSPVAANGCVVLCKHLFNIAKLRIKNWTGPNPAAGIERNPTQPRERYLKDTEIAALTKALDAYEDQDVADIFRLLMFTGARRGEAQAATWEQFELNAKPGIWTKPSSHTKQKKVHRVPLSPPALAVLTKRHAKADVELKKLEKEVAQTKAADQAAFEERMRRVETFIFPAQTGDRGHIWEIKKAWASLCKTADIKGARIHDLRHTAASVLASNGVSLIMIGKLLGHTQASTTARYAHLLDEAQQATADLLGAAISKAAKAKR
jgi:integrase